MLQSRLLRITPILVLGMLFAVAFALTEQPSSRPAVTGIEACASVSGINAVLAKDVTPENNAAIEIINAAGPKLYRKHFPDNDAQTDVWLKNVGIGSLPANGDYLRDKDNFSAATGQKNLGELLGSLIDGTYYSLPIADKSKETLQAWAKANEVPHLVMLGISDKNRLYFPLSEYGVTAHSIHLNYLLDLAKLALANALLDASKGDAAGAFAEAWACHHLADLIHQMPGVEVMAVSLKIDRAAFCIDRLVLENCDVPAKLADRYLRTLQSRPALPEIHDVAALDKKVLVDEVLLGQRAGISNLMHGLESGGFEGLSSPAQTRSAIEEKLAKAIDWEALQKGVAADYDAYLETIRHGTLDEKLKKWQSAIDELGKKKAKVMGQPPAMADPTDFLRMTLVWDSLVPGVSLQKVRNLLKARYENLAQTRLIQMALAVIRYRSNEGSYPAALDKIVQKFLDAVPEDPYSGKLFKYEKTPKGFRVFGESSVMAGSYLSLPNELDRDR